MEIIQKIAEKTGMSDEDIRRKIKEKQDELSGLISSEGAAYIIARELGIDLGTRTQKSLEIKNVLSGIRNLDISGRITRITQPKEFEKNGKKSSVASITLSDSTGSVRLSLWDDQTQLVKELKEGMAVAVFGGYTKEDNRGGVEIRLSKRGGLRILQDSDLPEIQARPAERGYTNLDDAKEGENYEIRAALLQIFESASFYEVCPSCGSRVRGPDFSCKTHGNVKPTYAMVISGVIDDGTWNMRAVFFRESAEKVLGMKTEEAYKKKDVLFDNLEDMLGSEFIFTGRVRKNQMFERLEFIVSDVKPVNVINEINKLINSLSANVK